MPYVNAAQAPRYDYFKLRQCESLIANGGTKVVKEQLIMPGKPERILEQIIPLIGKREVTIEAASDNDGEPEMVACWVEFTPATEEQLQEARNWIRNNPKPQYEIWHEAAF